MNSLEILKNTVQFPEYLKPHIKDLGELTQVNESVFGFFPRIETQKKDAENKKRTMLIVTGFSGAGKDTVVRKLCDNDQRFGWVKTCTTRTTIRPDEVDCDPYIRITEEQYCEAEKGGDFIEGNRYAGGSYCSLFSKFNEILEGFDIPVLRVDPSGTHFYSEKWMNGEIFFDKINLITVFIVPPTVNDLENRLANRKGTDAEEAANRLAKMNDDIKYLSEAEYIAINENNQLEKVVNNIKKILFP